MPFEVTGIETRFSLVLMKCFMVAVKVAHIYMRAEIEVMTVLFGQSVA
jgi:hypothetical protein